MAGVVARIDEQLLEFPIPINGATEELGFALVRMVETTTNRQRRIPHGELHAVFLVAFVALENEHSVLPVIRDFGPPIFRRQTAGELRLLVIIRVATHLQKEILLFATSVRDKN